VKKSSKFKLTYSLIGSFFSGGNPSVSFLPSEKIEQKLKVDFEHIENER
jgi:hypothetical protein